MKESREVLARLQIAHGQDVRPSQSEACTHGMDSRWVHEAKRGRDRLVDDGDLVLWRAIMANDLAARVLRYRDDHFCSTQRARDERVEDPSVARGERLREDGE